MTRSTRYSGGHNVVRSEDLSNTAGRISRREIISRDKKTSLKTTTTTTTTRR